MYKISELKNGVKFISHRVPSVDSVATGIWINMGGRFEGMPKSGISHFMEHMLFKGTKNRSATRLKEDIEGIGGVFNGFTDEEVTCYLTKVVSRHFDESLDVLADMVKDPLLLPEDVEKERQVILEEIRMYEDIPMQHVHELMYGLLWPDQPLGMPLSGTARTVNGISRRDLLDFKGSFYTARNIVVACCGNIEHDKCAKSVEKKLQGVKKGTRNSYAAAKVSQEKPQVKIQYKDTKQAHVSLGLHGLSKKDPDRYALNLLNIILGGNMSSRLFKEFREKRGLVYEVSSHARFLSDTGAFNVSAGLESKKLSEALTLIIKELARIRDSEVAKEELSRAKEYYTGQITLSMEDSMDFMVWLGQKLTTGDRIYSPKQIIEKIKKVTAGDIKRTAGRIIKDSNINLALIGPVKDNEKASLEALLDLGR